MNNEKPNQKETQGSQKIIQKLEDLKRNEYFAKDLKYVIDIHKAGEKYFDLSDKINKLFVEYIKLGKRAEKIFEELKDKDWTAAENEITEKYSIDSDLLSYLTFPILTRKILKQSPSAQIDVCCILDNYENFVFDENSKYFPLILDPLRKGHVIAYPVSIDIHQFATKRDVLDFVKKKWKNIEPLLLEHTGKKVLIRKRKNNQKLIDFIWENRNLKNEEIKKLLDKKFPQNALAYYEINKIVSLEKKRRKEKSSVSH